MFETSCEGFAWSMSGVCYLYKDTKNEDQVDSKYEVISGSKAKCINMYKWDQEIGQEYSDAGK